MNILRIPLLFCLLSATIFAGAADAAHRQQLKKISGRSRYAPYWYVDDATDSLLEVKSHFRDSAITLVPTVTMLDGRRAKLHSFTVPPYATVRLSLRAQLLTSQAPLQRTLPSSDSTPAYWGDGSRPNSLVGAVQLEVVSPDAATADNFNGWIRVENHSEKLGTLCMFENPGEAIGTALEGLWLAPYTDTQVYFALQNTTQTTVALRLALFDRGGRPLTIKSLKIPALGVRLINIRTLLGSRPLPQVGSATFKYLDAKPGAIVARGRLLQEKMHFSGSWKLQEVPPLGKAAAHTNSELHAPAAYFGKLNQLSHRGEAYLHPHLLLKNVSAHRISVSGKVYGKNSEGQPATLEIEPLVLDPNITAHIDLEQTRQRAKSTLADGPAGVQLRHDGAPRGIAAELLSIDETGHVVFYDDVRSRSFYQAAIQSAISFDLSNDNQSFLIIKNMTDKARKPRMVLDYNEGRDHYVVALAEIPPQQSAVVDIQYLRDSRIRDQNGAILPGQVTFGGAVIFSEPGTFVVSDPTFVYGHFTGPGGEDPPDETPFFLPSCSRDLSRSDECNGPGCCEWSCRPGRRARPTAFGICVFCPEDYSCVRPCFGGRCNNGIPQPPRVNPDDCKRGFTNGPCSREPDVCPRPPTPPPIPPTL